MSFSLSLSLFLSQSVFTSLSLSLSLRSYLSSHISLSMSDSPSSLPYLLFFSFRSLSLFFALCSFFLSYTILFLISLALSSLSVRKNLSELHFCMCVVLCVGVCRGVVWCAEHCAKITLWQQHPRPSQKKRIRQKQKKPLSTCGQQCIMNCQEHIHQISCLSLVPKRKKQNL